LEVPGENVTWQLDPVPGWQTFVLMLTSQPLSSAFLKDDLPTRVAGLPAVPATAGDKPHSCRRTKHDLSFAGASRVNTTPRPRYPQIEDRHQRLRKILGSFVDCLEILSIPQTA
jgi:hypothetical protein